VLGGLRSLFAVIHRREICRRGTSRANWNRRGPGVATGDARRAGDAACSTWQAFESMGRAISVHLDSGCDRRTICRAGDPIRGIDRMIKQGTRSERGNRWCETDLDGAGDVQSTGASVFAYLEAAVSAWFQGMSRRRCCRGRVERGERAGWPGRQVKVREKGVCSRTPPEHPFPEPGEILRRGDGREKTSRGWPMLSHW